MRPTSTTLTEAVVSSRPKLLLLVTLSETGGAQTYVASLLPGLVDTFEVTVAASGAGPLATAARDTGAEFVRLRHLRRPLRPWHDVPALIELAQLMRRKRPHIVHVSSAKAAALGRFAAWLTSVPVRIYTVHGWAYLAHDGFTGAAYRWIERLLRPLTTVTICISESERRAGLAARTCDGRSTVVIHNGVDLIGRPVTAMRHEIPQLIAVGRLRPPKDPITLVQALAALRPGSFHALLVGDGPDRPEVVAELRRLGLETDVELVGDRGDIPELLADSDIFVLSSRSEAFPLSILEAMAAELPVVASSVGGVPEIVVDGETGVLIPPEDPVSLARALAWLIGDADARRALGKAGRARVSERFDLASVQEAHRLLYCDVLASCGSPHSP
jgi:glycosyltransferase involved in cell wall biosynthesis